jgi:hypothetical protein
MADDEVRLTLKVQGSLTAEPLLKKAMSEQGVEVLSSTGRSRIWNRWPITTLLTDGASVVVLVQGSAVAVKAGLATFRRWSWSAKVEVEDESGNKLEGYL